MVDDQPEFAQRFLLSPLLLPLQHCASVPGLCVWMHVKTAVFFFKIACDWLSIDFSAVKMSSKACSYVIDGARESMYMCVVNLHSSVHWIFSVLNRSFTLFLPLNIGTLVFFFSSYFRGGICYRRGGSTRVWADLLCGGCVQSEKFTTIGSCLQYQKSQYSIKIF